MSKQSVLNTEIIRKLKYLFFYTLLFAVTAVLVFLPFILKNKSMIYTNDGYYQHYNALVYYGEYLKRVLRAIMQGGKIPMLDMGIGLGSDIVSTLHYYVLGEPLCLLSAFVPVRYMEYFFTFLVVLRMYIAGLTFSALALHHKNSPKVAAAGALIYAFSGYMLIPGVKHIMFAPAAMYLPLVILGAEFILKKKSPILFTIACALSLCSNFYFFFMIAELTVLYVVIRYIFAYSKKAEGFLDWIKNNIQAVAVLLVQFVLYGLWAVGIASVIFLPVASAMFSSRRMGVRHYLPLFFDLKYYLVNFAGFMTGEYLKDGTFYTYYGFTAMGLAGVLLLMIFCSSKKNSAYRSLKAGFLVMLIFTLIPACGYALSGFSYVNNRWAFGLALLVAYIFTRIVSDAIGSYHMGLTDKSRFPYVFLGLFVYFTICFVSETMRSEAVFAGVALAALLLAIYGIFRNGNMAENRFAAVVVILTVLSIAVNGNYIFSDLDGMLTRGVPTNGIMNNPAKIISDTEKSGESRFEAEDITDTLNMAAHSSLMGTSFYYSMLNGYVSEYFTENEVSNTTEYRFNGLDGRTQLDILGSVHKVMVREGEEYRLPYSYTELVKNETMGDAYSVYSSPLALPMGYLYDKRIDAESFSYMTALQKSQAMLQGVVISEEDEFSNEAAESFLPDFNEKNLPCELTFSEGVSRNNDGFFVTEENATVTLNFEPVNGTETYLEILNFDYKDTNPYENVDMSGMTIYDRLQLFKNKRNFVPEDKGYFKLEAGELKLSQSVNNNRQPAYSGKHDYLYNMGYSEKGISSIKITFEGIGQYYFDDIAVIALPMDNVKEYASVFKDRGEFEILSEAGCFADGRNMKAHVKAAKDGILCLSIPYSSGFMAYVDGEKQKLYRANTMHMALCLTQGEHEVELCYETPFIKVGFVITLASIIGILIYICVPYVRLKNMQKKKKL